MPKAGKVEDGSIEVHFVKTTNQIADIFIKSLDEKAFLRILNGFGMMEACYVPHST